MKIKYLNTDLDLKSNVRFDSLAQFLRKAGMIELTYGLMKKKWFGIYEVSTNQRNSEQTLRRFLKILERLSGDELKEWRGCNHKVFNIGFDCGNEPWAFSNSLSSDTLKRICALGAEIEITIYPEELSRHAT